MKKLLLLFIGVLACGFMHQDLMAQVGPGSTGQAAAPFGPETFVATALPAGWGSYFTTGNTWNTAVNQTNNSSCPNSGDGTPGGGTRWAQLDQSGTDVGNCLQLPDVDISALTIPTLQFNYFMCDGITPTNETYVEYWDGTAWQIAQSNTTGTPNGWEVRCVGLTGFTFDAGGDSVRLRFRAESGGNGSDFNADNSIDDVEIFDLPACTVPNATTVTPASATACGPTVSTLTATGLGVSGCAYTGFSFQWEESTDAGVTWGPAVGGTLVDDTTYTPPVLASGTIDYRLAVTCIASTTVTNSSVSTLTAGTPPTVALTTTPAVAGYCENSGGSVAFDASATTGATSYSWGPATDLSATTGAMVTANPNATTVYTVTASDAVGCTATSTVEVSVTPAPVLDSITATPDAVCTGTTSTLATNFEDPLFASTFDGYIFASSTGATLDPMVGATTIVASSVDDNISAVQNIGFNFEYDGVTYTQFKASPDGFMTFGSAGVNDFSNSILAPNAGNRPSVYPYWDDLATGTDGSVQFTVTGTAPNQILIVDWFVTAPRATAGPANANFQCWIYEGTNAIEFRYGAATPGTSASASIGAHGLNGPEYNSITSPAGTNSTTAANNNNTVLPAAGTMYSLTPPAPPAISYAWTPTAAVVNPTMASTATTPVNATTTYTVTASDATTGCSATATVTITTDPLGTPSATATPFLICATDSTQLDAVVTGGGLPYTYSWAPTTGMQPGAETTMNPMASPGVTTTYTVTITDACLNTVSATVLVVSINNPVVAATITATTVCDGSTTDLDATGANTYAWEPGALAGAMQTLTPTASGIYTVTGTDANGCTATSTVGFSYIAPFYDTASADMNPICEGATTNLIANDSMPVFTICQPVYTNGTGFGDFIDSVGAFGGAIANQTGASAAPYYNLYTTPNPTVAAGTPTSVTVRNGGFGSQAIDLWIDYNQNNLFETSEHLGQFSGVAAGAIVTFNFTIPTTAINGPTTMRVLDDYFGTTPINDPCAQNAYGEVEDYSITISGASAPPPPPVYTYAWMPGMLSGAAQAVTPTATTTYTVTQSDANGCTATSTVEITVNPTPTIAVTPMTVTSCDGSSTDLTASGAATYVWMPNAETTATIQTVNGTTAYSVTGTDAAGCTAMTTVSYTPVTPSGDLTQAGTGNAFSSAGTQCDTYTQPNDGSMYSYFDANCNIIASVQEPVGGADLGAVTTCATVVPTPPVYNGQPYVSRYFDITPTTQGPADVTLYFTDFDFADYNANNGAFPDIATNAGAATTATICIDQITGGTPGDPGSGTTTTHGPLTATWDATAMRWEVTFPVTGFSQFYCYTCNPNNAALPVEYKSFTVKKQATTDLVEWTTATETNNKEFIVQRSNDGTSFENLGTVATKAPNGNSSLDLSYSFVDESPALGHNYYRLMQVDIDNRTSNSKVIDIIWGAEGSVVSIYPNPASDVLNIDLETQKISNIEVKVLDMSGRIVKSIQAQSVSGLNNMTISLNDLATGIYGVQVYENNKLTHVQKVRKND